jgi:hypothetical protein
MKMLKKSAVLDAIAVAPAPAPVGAGAQYVAGAAEIRVPVFPLPSLPQEKQVFAPPFVVPPGEWKVTYTVQQLPGQTYVFDNVSYDNQAAAISIENHNPEQQRGGTTWLTTIGNEVTDVNMLSCTIFLTRQLGHSEFRSHSHRLLKGDPTIAVVKDPMG